MENSNLLYFTLKSILTESNEVKQKINNLKKDDILVLIKDLDKIKVATEDGVHLGFVPDIFFELISKSMTHDMASSIIDSIDNNIDSPSISLIYNFDKNTIKEKEETGLEEKEEVKSDNKAIQKPIDKSKTFLMTIIAIVVVVWSILGIIKCNDGGKTQAPVNLNIDSDSVIQVEPQSEIKAPEKKINRDSIIRVMHKDFIFRKDEYKSQDFLWVEPKSSTKFRNVNRLFAYFALENGKPVNLRIVLQYTSDDWLFIQSCIFNVDGSVYTYTPTDMQTDNGIVDDESKIWEWFDESLSGMDYSTFEAIGNAKVVKMKLNGRQYYDSRRLTKSEIYYIGKTLKYYKELGGVIPSE